MHTLMIVVATALVLGLGGIGVITILHRLDRADVRLAAVEHNQAQHMRITARGVAVVEGIDQPSGPHRIPARRR